MRSRHLFVVNNEVDVLIIGGGLTGAMLSLALAQSSYTTLLVDSKPLDIKQKEGFDARSLALSPASARILSMLGVWGKLEAFTAPIKNIHVSEQKRVGATRLQGETNQLLGHVVEMQSLFAAINPLINKKNVLAPAQVTQIDEKTGTATVTTSEHKSLTIKAGLIVAADGADSFVRKSLGLQADVKSYNQSALVANIGLSRTHHGIAYERFTSKGPLALLPMTDNRVAMVWSLEPLEAEKMMLIEEKLFINQLHDVFGYRLGRLNKVGHRAIFPLRQVIMKQQAAWPVIFIGNAAHTLHPVAGQGFNLGLRDVALLAQYIIKHGIHRDMLNQYQQERSHDQTAIRYFTDGLVELFNNKTPGLSTARGCGLLLLDHLAPLKKLVSRYASGFAGVAPDLVCNIPLTEEVGG
jgi:2-octaprenyl-6-methoxyphenol hydroxylase